VTGGSARTLRGNAKCACVLGGPLVQSRAARRGSSTSQAESQRLFNGPAIVAVIVLVCPFSFLHLPISCHPNSLQNFATMTSPSSDIKLAQDENTATETAGKTTEQNKLPSNFHALLLNRNNKKPLATKNSTSQVPSTPSNVSFNLCCTSVRVTSSFVDKKTASEQVVQFSHR